MRGRLARLIRRFLPEGAAILSILTFASYVLGLVRDRSLATTFGAGSELDVYNAAFQLPEVLLDVLVESGLAAAFVPIFLALRTRGDPADAGRFARTILSGAVGIMGITAAILFVLAEATTDLIAPSFTPAQQTVYVDLFRLMLATPILFAASLTLGNVLLAEQRFAWYGAAPLLYNAGIILGTLALAPAIGIYGTAVGAVLGATLHLGSRVVGLRGSIFRVGLSRSLRGPGVREFVRLMLPKMVSHPIESTTFLFFTRVASGLAVGSVTSVNFARNFQSVPVSVIGVAFALAVFPALSTAHAAGDRRSFLRLLGRNILAITTFTTAAAIVLVVAGELVIRTFLGGGAFDEADVALTATLLAIFAISIPLESLTHLLSRAIYATRHTVLQVLASLASLGVTVAAAQLLVDELGVAAIPFSFAGGQAAKVVLLALALAVRLRGWPDDGAKPGDSDHDLGGGPPVS